jgi:hypothetical protein
LERQSGQKKPVFVHKRQSLRKGEDSERNTDFFAGKIPEGEKP